MLCQILELEIPRSFDVPFSDPGLLILSYLQSEPVCHGQYLGSRACEPFTRLPQRETQLPALQQVVRSRDVHHCSYNIGFLAILFLLCYPPQRPTTCHTLSLLGAKRRQRLAPLLLSEEHLDHGCTKPSSPHLYFVPSREAHDITLNRPSSRRHTIEPA